MQSEIRKTEQWGDVLWLEHGEIQIGVALEFGIRIVHLSLKGMENLYYVQPNDLSDNFTKGDWRVYGGHRLWMAPECLESYCPDNNPVHYEIGGNTAFIRQDVDPWLHIEKHINIIFLEDGSVQLTQIIVNCSDKPITCASWGVNTLDGGGVATINFAGERGFNPKRVVSLWGLTNLHDPRIQFQSDCVTATHMADVPEYFKIGLYVNPGKVVLQNKGQQLTITFDAEPMDRYMDGGCNFELFLCRKFMELETLGVRTEMGPGENATHCETWYLEKL